MIFSSLPAKVWVCGLGLCPMGHQQSSPAALAEKPLCHDHKKVAQVSEEQPKINKICPCPENRLSTAFLPQTRWQLESSAAMAVSETAVTFKLLAERNVGLRYRPPPDKSYSRLHLIHQVFII